MNFFCHIYANFSCFFSPCLPRGGRLQKKVTLWACWGIFGQFLALKLLRTINTQITTPSGPWFWVFKLKTGRLLFGRFLHEFQPPPLFPRHPPLDLLWLSNVWMSWGSVCLPYRLVFNDKGKAEACEDLRPPHGTCFGVCEACNCFAANCNQTPGNALDRELCQIMLRVCQECWQALFSWQAMIYAHPCFFLISNYFQKTSLWWFAPIQCLITPFWTQSSQKPKASHLKSPQFW